MQFPLEARRLVPFKVYILLFSTTFPPARTTTTPTSDDDDVATKIGFVFCCHNRRILVLLFSPIFLTHSGGLLPHPVPLPLAPPPHYRPLKSIAVMSLYIVRRHHYVVEAAAQERFTLSPTFLVSLPLTLSLHKMLPPRRGFDTPRRNVNEFSHCHTTHPPTKLTLQRKPPVRHRSPQHTKGSRCVTQNS